ncbi:MAG TPA: TRAP transporter substrate-binding protein, partial [Chloroflexota bacterium]|nr:TRAP transporter substrate-binding protein [Chloroflexota bacterium]
MARWSFSESRKARSVVGLTLVGAMAALVVACSSGAPAAQPTSAPAKPAAAATSAPAAAATKAPAAAATTAPAAGAVVTKFASVQAEDHAHHLSYLFFAQRVKELTGGKLIINIYPNSQLGNEREYIEQLRTGQIEFARVATAVLGPFVPQFQAFDLPYLFKSKAQMLSAADGELGALLQKQLQEKLGIRGLGFLDDGTRSLYNNKRPVKTLADLKGMKVRVMENQLMIKTFNTLGAAATPMAYGEVYSALQQGVIDAAEGPINSYWAVKHFEVAKYFSFTDHFISPALPMVAKKWYDAQPKEFQTAIDQAGKEMSMKSRELQNAQEKSAETELKAKGSQINQVDDKAPFMKAVEPLYAEYEGKIGKDVIEMARNAK